MRPLKLISVLIVVSVIFSVLSLSSCGNSENTADPSGRETEKTASAQITTEYSSAQSSQTETENLSSETETTAAAESSGTSETTQIDTTASTAASTTSTTAAQTTTGKSAATTTTKAPVTTTTAKATTTTAKRTTTTSAKTESTAPETTTATAAKTTGAPVYGRTDELMELYISEVMSSNKSYAPYKGKYYDFVELFNNSSSDIKLSDYYLTDDAEKPNKYRLPEITLKPGEYYLVYCSELNETGHANFKISSDGEDVTLLKNGEIVDKITVPSDLMQDESYGRNGAELVYMPTPTPGKANAKGVASSLKAPKAEPASGSYDHSVSVVLSGEGKIYYTLDGTEPTSSSKLYTSPIAVDKIASVRAVCIKDGRTSPLASFFYLVNVDHAHPVIDVAIKQSYLTGSEGVLNHVNPEYEHEAYVTMMENGKVSFSAPCGFKLHGNGSKKLEKQNFQLRFRSEYGLSKLKYKVFENRSYDVFNSLILHGGSEDYNVAGFRDELCTSLVDGKTNLYVLACRPVVLYLNGQYWGIYWLRERFDAQYCANNLGVSKDSINLLHIYGGVSVGSNKEYLALIEFCKSNDLRKEENYKRVMSQIDATSLMDWYICRSYFADHDLANIKYFCSKEKDGKWRWCFFDLDWAFYHNNVQAIDQVMPNDGHHVLILSLLKNAEFKDMFLKRYAYIMKNVLNEKTILEKLAVFEAQMKPELAANHARFGINTKYWQGFLDKIRDFVKDGLRDKNVLQSIKNYFSLSDSEMKKYFS